MKMISVVIPVYNEQYNVSLAYTAIREVLMTFKGQYDYEIIFMDNRSTDGTFTKLKEIAEKEKTLSNPDVSSLVENVSYVGSNNDQIFFEIKSITQEL